MEADLVEVATQRRRHRQGRRSASPSGRLVGRALTIISGDVRPTCSSDGHLTKERPRRAGSAGRVSAPRSAFCRRTLPVTEAARQPKPYLRTAGCSFFFSGFPPSGTFTAFRKSTANPEGDPMTSAMKWKATTATLIAAFAWQQRAFGEVPIGEGGGWKLTTDGRVNAFISVDRGNGIPEGQPDYVGTVTRDRTHDVAGNIRGTRIRNGFLSSILAFELSNQ